MTKATVPDLAPRPSLPQAVERAAMLAGAKRMARENRKSAP